MRFPTSARYKNIMEAVKLFFIKENITDFPIDPIQIINKNGWGLLPYSVLAKNFNISVEEVVDTFQSEDGCVMLDKDNYTIAYNDSRNSEGRIRFTLMHEIGHIYLNHLIDFDETMQKRSALTKSKYDILEREAHAFARNALAPTAVINQLKKLKKDKSVNFVDLMYCFKITQPAAKTRLDFMDWDSTHAMIYGSSYLEQFSKYIHSIIHANHCLQCKNFFTHENANFCPVCGHNKFSKRKGNDIMIYKGYELNDKGFPHDCPRCGNEEIFNGEYCKICGLHLVNRCTNIHYDRDGDLEWQCKTITKGINADGNARHCIECGGHTTYLVNELLVPWDVEINNKK